MREDISIKLIDVEVDGLTNSILNTISGDSFDTEILKVQRNSLNSVSKVKGWNFDWKLELNLSDREVYKLYIKNNEKIIQGLMSISDKRDHFYLHLIESAPFNLGKNKLYAGVPGNLFAFACKLSFEKGYEGFISFQSKTKLIDHYESTLGATHVGGHKMVIFTESAQKLVWQYFKNQ